MKYYEFPYIQHNIITQKRADTKAPALFNHVSLNLLAEYFSAYYFPAICQPQVIESFWQP